MSSSVGGNRPYCTRKFSSAPARSCRRSGQGSSGESAVICVLFCGALAGVVELVSDLQPVSRAMNRTQIIHRITRSFLSAKNTKAHEVLRASGCAALPPWNLPLVPLVDQFL